MDSLLKSVENCISKSKENSEEAKTIDEIISEFFSIKELLEEIQSTSDQKTPLAPQQISEVPRCVVAPADQENALPPRAPTPTCSVKRATEEEYNKIAKYISRNMSLNDLNIAIDGLEKAVLERLKLRKAKFGELSKSAKDKVVKIREEQQGLKLDKSSMYCSEEEWKDCLDLRMKAKLKWAIQMLRHIKRIRDTPFKGMSDSFELRSILRQGTAEDGKQNNGMFLVEWKPSFVSKDSLDKNALNDFLQRGAAAGGKVLGPVKPNNSKVQEIKNWKWAIQFGSEEQWHEAQQIKKCKDLLGNDVFANYFCDDLIKHLEDSNIEKKNRQKTYTQIGWCKN
ncbi:hypothetical protein FO519_008014 [Halicephalobus sp. NKZ332]|nr:hypothetical protein FO519_008014 [Halicephalobus sp. NKZ332]